MSRPNLRLIALERHKDPMNTWPEHNSYHSRTIMGNWLKDYDCLRCHLEVVAADAAKDARDKAQAAAEAASKQIDDGRKRAFECNVFPLFPSRGDGDGI